MCGEGNGECWEKRKRVTHAAGVLGEETLTLSATKEEASHNSSTDSSLIK